MAQQVQLPARFANRQNRRSIVQAVTQGLGTASPPYVSIKGGNFTLVDANGEQEPVETKHLDCVIIDTNLPSRVFWGEKVYNPNADTYEPPVCYSDNGIGASSQAAQPQSPNCMSCPQNTWGSAVSKVTGKPVKACHIIKKVAILPLTTTEVEVTLANGTKVRQPTISADGCYVPNDIFDFPFLLRVPVMSHENLRAYSDKFRGQDFDVSEVVTRISFVHGQVGQLDFAAAGFTDAATETMVQGFLDQKVTDGLVGRGDVPWNGVVAPAQVTQQRPLAPAAPALPAGVAAVTGTSPPIQDAGAAPFAGASAEPPKTRGRPRKPAAESAPDAGGIPAFLQRQPAAQAPAGPFQQPQGSQFGSGANGPAGGIVHNAPAPNAELEQALANVFGLKT